MDHPQARLKYVDAEAFPASDIDFDGMKVRNDAMETLGSVAGFIVDRTSARPYYVVVDSGGWFKSQEFVVPIGRARIDDDRDALVLDIPKERIEQFPAFDRSRVAQLSEDDTRRMSDAISAACDDAPATYTPTDPLAPLWSRPGYTQPEWWAIMSPAGASPVVTGGTDTAIPSAEGYPATRVPRAMGELQAEQMLAREKTQAHTSDKQRASGRTDGAARETDSSPYPGGRAQPGDVLGLETGGEETHIGDTTEDENERRVDALRANAKRRE